MKTATIRLGEHNYGMATALEFAMEFRRWADAERQVTPAKIQTRWNVSRATAYRWNLSYQAVIGREAAA